MTTFPRRMIAAVLVGGVVLSGLGVGMTATVAAAAEPEGGDPRFEGAIATRVGSKPVRLVLTGTAVRTKYMLSVYTIGSYLQEGVKVRGQPRSWHGPPHRSSCT